MIVLGSVFSTLAGNKIKVISYNIWNGYEWGKDTLRKEKLLAWMDSRKPDVVALQELCAYTDDKLRADAEAWGHDYSVLLKTTGYSVGLTSRFPIKIKERLVDGMHHGALYCETNGIEIFVIHLSPFQWEKRNEEAIILLERIKGDLEKSKNVIVCGDFNALSPIDSDWYKNNQVLLNSMKQSDADHQHVKNLRNGTFCYSAISKFLGAGLYDVCSEYSEQGTGRISCPTLVFANNKQEEEQLIQKGTRIDFILTSYNLVRKCINASVLNGVETSCLSDHYPIEATFEDVITE